MAADETRDHLTLAFTPQGHLRLAQAPPDLPGASSGALSGLVEAFSVSEGHGLLWLSEASGQRASLPEPFGFWRRFAREFLARVRSAGSLEARGGSVEVEPAAGALETMLERLPPMVGGEYLAPDSCARLWGELQAALTRELATFDGTTGAFLAQLDPIWTQVGRVHFHLAERKGDEGTPFAFLGTYTTRPGAGGGLSHLPLGRALTELAGDRDALLSLLQPVHRASKASPWMKSLVDLGAVFRPLAWTPDEAYAFLRELPVLEAAGIIVKVPDWWSRRNASRPRVRLSVGGREPASLGLDALLSFDVEVSLGEEELTAQDLKALLQGADGLVRLKGQWVEIDKQKLSEVLQHWKQLERHASGGVSFLEGMRLLAGAGLPGSNGGDEPDAAGNWSERVAGPWLAEALRGLRDPVSIDELEKDGSLQATLRPYQRIGVGWLAQLDRLRLGGCLADDMGLGKTVQLLALFLLLKRRPGRGPHLLVVPASLIANWEAEARRFAPSLSLALLHPSVRGERGSLPPGTDLAITSYGYVQRLAWVREAEWDLVVLDEAQAIKNAGTRQTRFIKQLRARGRFALTGTPVENHLSELWSLFDFLDPGLLGNARAFAGWAKRLSGRDEDRYGPLRRLVRPYILRRMKTDRTVISDLPEKTEMLAYCSLTRRQAALYQESVEELARKLETLEGIQRRGMVLAFLTRLKQICNHPSQWLGDGGFEPEESGKFSRLGEIAEELASRQQKLLVFTQYREMTDPLATFLAARFGRPGLVLHGGTAVGKRRELVRTFQEDESSPFFVLSLKAGGTGLNLTAASNVLHFDRWWNPAVEEQATDRAFRIGQRKNVLVHKFLCRGTVEEKIEQMLAAKRAMSSELFEGSGEAALTELDNGELLAMLRLDLDRAMSES